MQVVTRLIQCMTYFSCAPRSKNAEAFFNVMQDGQIPQIRQMFGLRDFFFLTKHGKSFIIGIRMIM